MKNNEVSFRGGADVYKGLMDFGKKVAETGRFSANEFMTEMEPVYLAAGYRERKQANDLQKILVIHDSGVGDFINFSASLRELRRIYPKTEITLVIYPRYAALAEECPYIDHLELNARACRWDDFMQLYRWNVEFAETRLLPHRFDMAFVFNSWGSSVLLGYMSGAAVRVGFAKTGNRLGAMPHDVLVDLLTVQVPRDKSYGCHSVDCYLSILDECLHSPVANRSIEVWLTKSDELFPDRIFPSNWRGKRIIAITFGGTAKRKQWPPERFAAVLRELLNHDETLRFVLLGGTEDLADSDIVVQTVSRQNVCINLVGKTNFRQSAAILKQCVSYVGSDTGTMHLAAAMGVPVLGIYCFPADHPRHSDSVLISCTPYHVPSVLVLPPHGLDECSEPGDSYGCRRVNERHCILQITPDLVVEGYRRLQEQIAQGATKPIYITEQSVGLRKHMRLLFIGNSITLHGICNYWFGEWGMAASSCDKDFVHRVVDGLSREEELTYECMNFSKWEMMDDDRVETLVLLDKFLEKEPERIVVQLGENIRDTSTLLEDMRELVGYLREKVPAAKIYFVGNFWKNDAVDAIKQQICREEGAVWISLQNIQNDPAYRVGLGAIVKDNEGESHVVEHSGVARHPGDKGMEVIAERILEAF